MVATYHDTLPPSRDEPWLNNIIKALKKCVIEHPVLCTVIQQAETEHPQLAKLSSIDLGDHIGVPDPTLPTGDSKSVESDVQDFLTRVHNEPLLDCHIRPQWRLYVLPLKPHNYSSPSAQSFRIAFSYSHALADGMSGPLFHTTFREALQQVADLPFDADLKWEIPDTQRVILPPIEKAGNFTLSWSYLLGPIVAEFISQRLARRLGISDNTDGAWIGAPVRPKRPAAPPQELVQTALRVALVPQPTVQHVLAVCRTRKVRLTGLLNQIAAKALAAALHARGQEYRKFIASTPVNLRRCLPNSQGCMANYPTGLSEVLTISLLPEPEAYKLTNEDWNSARHQTEHLEQVSNTLADQPVGLLRYLPNIRNWVVKEAERPAEESFSISNLGVFEDELEESPSAHHPKRWAIEDMIYSQSADATGAPLNINVVSLKKRGPLAIVPSWWPGMLTVDDEEQFVEDICENMKNQLTNIV